MERQHMTYLRKPLKTLPSWITKVTIRSCTLYHFQQFNPPLILQWLLSARANEYLKFVPHFACTYLASVVISTWLRHCVQICTLPHSLMLGCLGRLVSISTSASIHCIMLLSWDLSIIFTANSCPVSLEIHLLTVLDSPLVGENGEGGRRRKTGIYQSFTLLRGPLFFTHRPRTSLGSYFVWNSSCSRPTLSSISCAEWARADF